MGHGFCSQCNKDCALIEDGGEACCMECGTVVADNRAVETIEFDDSGGSARVVGTRVDKFGSVHGVGKNGYSRPSSEVTLSRARENIEEVVYNLKMPHRIVKGATRLYKLLLSNNFTRGRRTTNVLAAVVYATCRMDTPRPLPYMLIDFSDYFSVNVFELGHTFLRLSELLSLRLPLVDPSIYIPRYARELNFGGKEQKISKCAVRLVARMKRDWIVTGRRPGGICAAALLIAARLSGFKRGVDEVAALVHLSVTTINTRLSEFKETSTCNLTPVEFDAILDFDDLEASDPPCFTRSRKQAEERRNQPVLTADEIHASIKAALGDIGDEDLDNISSSNLAPANERRDQIRSASDAEPPTKKTKTGSHPLSDEEDELDLNLFDPLNPDNYIYSEYPEDEAQEPEEHIEESLSDIDDAEIDLLINDSAEIRMNEIIWDSMYSDWEKEKKDKEDLQKENGTYRPKYVQRKRETKLAESPAEAVSTVLARKLVSSKINQSAIERLVQASVDCTRPSGNPLLNFVKLPRNNPSVNENE